MSYLEEEKIRKIFVALRHSW